MTTLQHDQLNQDMLIICVGGLGFIALVFLAILIGTFVPRRK